MIQVYKPNFVPRKTCLQQVDRGGNYLSCPGITTGI